MSAVKLTQKDQKDPMYRAIEAGNTTEVSNLIENGWTFDENTVWAFEMAADHSPELAIRILQSADLSKFDTYIVKIVAVHHGGPLLEYLRDIGLSFNENELAGVIDSLRQDPNAKSLRILFSRTAEGKRWCPLPYIDINFGWLAKLASQDDGLPDVIIDDDNYDDDIAIAQAERRSAREARAMLDIFIDSVENDIEQKCIDAALAKLSEC